jgi:hypothetical protein
MSGELKIRFAPDMPSLAVTVVAPDMSVVKRMMIGPNDSSTVQVPSEGSFLRVVLPSGEIATLNDPGNLDRLITLDALKSRRSRSGSSPSSEADRLSVSEGNIASVEGIRQHHSWQSSNPPDDSSIPVSVEIPLGAFASASLLDPQHAPQPGKGISNQREASWNLSGPPFQQPFDLNIRQQDGTLTLIRIPGNVERLWVRADEVYQKDSLVFSVRAISSQPISDTILNYLRLGYLNAAACMTEWAEKSEQMLASKMADPYAATVGAYLLFKLKDYDRMHNWVRNLAEWFPFLPDPCILWAWQLIKQNPQDREQIRSYLAKAVDRGIPIYSEGLRLLLAGLELLGSDGAGPLAQLRQILGQVIRESPVTARVLGASNASASGTHNHVTFDVQFGTTA